MKKKSIAARLGVAALALTLVTTSLSSGTLAKYTETFGAKASLEIAKWNVAATITKDAEGKTEWVVTQTGTELNTGKLADTAYGSENALGVKDGQVAAGKLAPGMSGEFTVNVTSAKENIPSGIDVLYEIYINKTGTTPQNLTMTMGDGGTPVTLTGAKADEELGWSLGSGRLKNNTNATEHVTVKWAWPYETSGGAGDTQDTLEGKSGATGLYTISVRFTQANPTEAVAGT